MNRLFTFGCSFTNYYLWPTWADILAEDYTMFFNWGHPGLGNKAISERVAEAHARNKFTKDDTVIVQWSSHLRNDWLNFKMIKTDHSYWRTKGSIFSKENQKLYDNKWMMTFWDEKAYYLHTLNHIMLTQGLLESIGCKWYMTSMHDLGKISKEVSPATVDGELPTEENQIFDVWANTPEFLDYKERIIDDHLDRWVLPIVELCNSTHNEHWWFKHDLSNVKEKDFNVYQGRWMEPHPSVVQHAKWLLLLKEKMGEEKQLSENQQALVDLFNEIKSTVETYREFEDKVKNTEWASNLMYLGY